MMDNSYTADPKEDAAARAMSKFKRIMEYDHNEVKEGAKSTSELLGLLVKSAGLPQHHAYSVLMGMELQAHFATRALIRRVLMQSAVQSYSLAGDKLRKFLKERGRSTTHMDDTPEDVDALLQDVTTSIMALVRFQDKFGLGLEDFANSAPYILRDVLSCGGLIDVPDSLQPRVLEVNAKKKTVTRRGE